MRVGALGQAGVTLIELMITLVILAILVSLGAPGYGQWLQNRQIRTGTESMLAAIQLARAEAVRRNAVVSFNLVGSLASCTASAAGTAWTVSLGTAPVCNPGSGSFIQARAGEEATPSVTVTATRADGGTATSVAFDGLGRVAAAGVASAIFRIAVDSAALASADSRDLQIQVSSGGQIRMCDPAVSTTGDPRKC